MKHSFATAASIVLIALCALICQPTELSASPSANASSEMANPKSGQPKGEFPNDWYYYENGAQLAQLRELVGKPPPPLTVKNWIGEPQNPPDLKGRVVVVDFWATWCGPCMKSLPHNVEMYNKYKDKGLMIIGVHDAQRGSEKMAGVAQSKKITYPLSIDDGMKSAGAYRVAFWPTYIVIDRKGIVRAAGLDPDHVEDVVKKLLAEPGGEANHPATKPATSHPATQPAGSGR